MVWITPSRPSLPRPDIITEGRSKPFSIPRSFIYFLYCRLRRTLVGNYFHHIHEASLDSYRFLAHVMGLAPVSPTPPRTQLRSTPPLSPESSQARYLFIQLRGPRAYTYKTDVYQIFNAIPRDTGTNSSFQAWHTLTSGRKDGPRSPRNGAQAEVYIATQRLS